MSGVCINVEAELETLSFIHQTSIFLHNTVTLNLLLKCLNAIKYPQKSSPHFLLWKLNSAVAHDKTICSQQVSLC